MSFTSFNLSPRILKGVEEAGYITPTEIQRKAIPIVLEKSDLIGCSKTGSGKTAAFVLPILSHLTEGSPDRLHRHPRALVLAPTRELALQIEESIRMLGRHTKLQSVTIYGGVDINPQLKKLNQRVDIAVATPGRLLDVIERGAIDFSHLSVLVLDEADRMFDMGFIQDVRRIISQLPKERQTLLFSATMPSSVEGLIRSVMRQPRRIDVGERRNPVETVTQRVYPVRQDLKLELLFHMLDRKEMESVLIFSRTKHGADKITRKLERNGVRAIAFHSDRSQNQRQRALEGFKQGHYKVLVATDIAARGIDVEGISHVINFDAPMIADDYIHRIGRTGRAGATGDALTFVSAHEELQWMKIEISIGKRLERTRDPEFDYTQPPKIEPLRNYSNSSSESRGSSQRRRTNTRSRQASSQSMSRNSTRRER